MLTFLPDLLLVIILKVLSLGEMDHYFKLNVYLESDHHAKN